MPQSDSPPGAGGAADDGAETPALRPEEYRRYGRHLSLTEVGEAGQRRLKGAAVLVVGAGGLGCPVALYLAAAGVGRITLCDFDVVDASNLQRQVLFTTDDVGRPKVEAASDRLRALNPHVAVEAVNDRVDASNVRTLVRSSDVVVDGSDNFTTRYLVGDACVLESRPYVYGSIHRFEGQASVFGLPDGPCYRCLFPDPPPDALVPNCAQAGVLGVLPGLVGSVQATETLKVLLGIGDTLSGRLLLVDALGCDMRTVRLRRDPACALCGDSPSIFDAVETGVPACTAADGSTVDDAVSPRDLSRMLDDPVPPLLLDVREDWEFRGGALAGSRHIALGDVQLEGGRLPEDRDIVVVCRIGPRARRAAELLRQAGLARARWLSGGLLAWQDQVDPSARFA